MAVRYQGLAAAIVARPPPPMLYNTYDDMYPAAALPTKGGDLYKNKPRHLSSCNRCSSEKQ